MQSREGRLTSSSGAKPVPYLRMPRTSPRACLNAVPSAIAESCADQNTVSTSPLCTVVGRSRLICRVVVVDVQVALARHLERHARVLRERMEHLHVKSSNQHPYNREGTQRGGAAYVVEEADPGGDADLLLVARAGLAVEVDRDADLRLRRLALNHCRACCHFSLSQCYAVAEF